MWIWPRPIIGGLVQTPVSGLPACVRSDQLSPCMRVFKGPGLPGRKASTYMSQERDPLSHPRISSRASFPSNLLSLFSFSSTNGTAERTPNPDGLLASPAAGQSARARDLRPVPCLDIRSSCQLHHHCPFNSRVRSPLSTPFNEGFAGKLKFYNTSPIPPPPLPPHPSPPLPSPRTTSRLLLLLSVPGPIELRPIAISSSSSQRTIHHSSARFNEWA